MLHVFEWGKGKINIWHRTSAPFTFGQSKLPIWCLTDAKKKTFIKFCTYSKEGHCLQVCASFTVLGHFQMGKDM
jgi:hypothetical protein